MSDYQETLSKAQQILEAISYAAGVGLVFVGFLVKVEKLRTKSA